MAEALTGHDIQMVRNGAELECRLAGDLTLAAGTLRGGELVDSVSPSDRRVALIDAGIEKWDSALLILILRVRQRCEALDVALDLSGLPQGARRLIELAAEVPPREGARSSAAPLSVLARIGEWGIRNARAMREVLTFVGEAAISTGRFVTGRARYRRSELWLIIEQCGPQALGVVTTISVLVGAILAFVGAIQLKLFGAEVYVANLVGLGMVIEMGALMTGIILAGRTGAAFAAQLGTMQVNEEIDALKTMGIPPMDYLVMPRMVALAIMTPLLVIYADILGIMGGGVVGIFVLKIPFAVYVSETLSLMTVWHCAQGLIKGSTFGVLVAICGCMRGMTCGRSALAVGEATTSAVVTSIMAIVLADAVWTFAFMVIG